MVSFLTQDNHYLSFVGIVLILFVAFLFSRNKKRINIRLVVSALAMQFVLAFFILKTSIGQDLFFLISNGFSKLYQFSSAGGGFVFGKLADMTGVWGALFFVKVIPIIIFFGALMALLFHFGIIQVCVKGIAFLIRPLLGTSGAETLCAASNSMLGQTEAPLLIKRYLHNMSDSEILLVMISGMATMNGALLAVYGSMGVPMLHLLSASVMAVPGAILISKILLPETDETKLGKQEDVVMESDSKNALDAISNGTTDGMRLAANVMAMLIAFISLIALVNFTIGGITEYVIGTRYTLDTIFAKVFSWVALLIGVPMADKEGAGALIGQKLVINEFFAYANMVTMELSVRAKTLLTYALCGFANFSSIGIQIGGIGALVPEKRHVLVRYGLMAVLGGALANLLNAAIASLFI
jgi:concentrative nucleoside transporter, CNT family